MPKKVKDDDFRTVACKHLKTIDAVSNSGLPLCFCIARNFNLSPYNIVCQVCALYKENNEGTTHTEMFIAVEAPNFQYDPNKFQRINQGYVEDTEDLEETEEETEDEEGDEESEEPRVRSKKRKRAPREEVEEAPEEEEKEEKEVEEEPEEEEAEEEPEEEEEFEEETEEEEAPIILGPEEAPEEEEELDYEDEREEGLGKRHGLLEEEEEDEELEEEIEDIEEEGEAPAEADEESEAEADIEEGGEGSGVTIDFEADVVAKIKKIGDKELCPYCGKSKASVVRHLPKCKRVPSEVLTAYELFKSNSKKKGGKAAEKDEDEDALDD